MGGRPMADHHWKNARGRLADPPGPGTPCRVPSSPLFATLLDVSPSLEGQTTFKSDEIKTITSVSKRASQGTRIASIQHRYFKKSSKNQRRLGKKDQLREKGGRPTRSPPPKEVGHWPTPTTKAPGSCPDDPGGRATPRTCFIRLLPTSRPV